MPGNQYNGNSNQFPGRVERLLRVRELRKSSRASYNTNDVTDNHKGSEPCENDSCFRDGDNLSNSHLEQYLEASARAALFDGYEKPDGKPTRQRLLVVANRLPVSAVRRGEDSWSLEISAGGLVSALLGNAIYIFFFCTLIVCSFKKPFYF